MWVSLLYPGFVVVKPCFVRNWYLRSSQTQCFTVIYGEIKSGIISALKLLHIGSLICEIFKDLTNQTKWMQAEHVTVWMFAYLRLIICTCWIRLLFKQAETKFQRILMHISRSRPNIFLKQIIFPIQFEKWKTEQPMTLSVEERAEKESI